jgi:hypothetical protein
MVVGNLSDIADLGTSRCHTAEELNARSMEMNMKTFITGAVGACLLLPIISAGVQADPARIPPIGALQPGNLSPDALARFKLEAISFRALNETGWDRLGSDEVYVTIHVRTHKIATRTQVFGNIDAGVTQSIPANQSCILPIAGVSASNRTQAFFADQGDRWSCSRDGAAGPFSFRVILREKDPEGGCYPPYFYCALDHGYVEGTEPGPIGVRDDLIGRKTVVYSMEELIALQVGQVVEESITLRPCESIDASEFHCPSHEAVYEFKWRLTRLPDAEPVVGPITRLREPNSRE